MRLHLLLSNTQLSIGRVLERHRLKRLTNQDCKESAAARNLPEWYFHSSSFRSGQLSRRLLPLNIRRGVSLALEQSSLGATWRLAPISDRISSSAQREIRVEITSSFFSTSPKNVHIFLPFAFFKSINEYFTAIIMTVQQFPIF